MLHVGRHKSQDDPPDVPYFRGTKKHKLEEQCAGAASPTCFASPGKRVSMRSECIEQLGKWYSLFEKGAISQSDYDELQSVIKKDIFSDFRN